LIPDGGAFELGPEGFRAPMRDKMPHGLIDESTASARFGNPVNGTDRGFRQNNVDAFVHGN